MSDILESSVYGVNELGELVATVGEGSSDVVAYLPHHYTPVNSFGQLVIAGVAGEAATQLALNNKLSMGTVQNIDTSTTSGIVYPTISFRLQKFEPTSSPAGAIRFTDIRRYEYNTTQSNSGVGHHVAGLDWYVHKNIGNPNIAYAHEAKIDNESAGATISSAIGSEAQLSSNVGTITSLIGMQSRITGNVGTVTTFNGFRVDVTANTGAIGNVIGFDFTDLSTLLPSANRVAFVNRDPGAVIISAGPIVDQSITYASPAATGFTVTIPNKKTILLLTPAAEYADGTINFPAKASVSDSQTMEITTSQAVTAITWGVNGATFVLNGPTGLTAGQTVRFRYFAALDWWVRV